MPAGCGAHHVALAVTWATGSMTSQISAMSPPAIRSTSTTTISGPPPGSRRRVCTTTWSPSASRCRTSSRRPYEELLLPEPGDPGLRAEADVVIPMVLRLGGRELRLFSTITTFGTPVDITIDEIAIESYHPADAESAAYFRA